MKMKWNEMNEWMKMKWKMKWNWMNENENEWMKMKMKNTLLIPEGKFNIVAIIIKMTIIMTIKKIIMNW